ncbi:hypothetical protein FN846DRAFT_896211 [Sphaerosporella brunnea]|uniref:Uncharacterized protein n=1 Tax=Sphaerosporella brunnea TaxID=1250544 RepID=A0A5J5EDX9_9PEZI|nr:hypothetical protein FN846DRAFT_896211 [Sphaerosporella brunnea]
MQKEQRDLARQAGKASWRFIGKEKIVEVFFNINLEEVKGSVTGTPMAQALKDAEEYEELPEGQSYLALDTHLVPIVALYANAFDRVWGQVYAQYIIKTTAENIDKVARFVQPVQQIDLRRHSGHKEWIAEAVNQQFSWASGPDARTGIYYLGVSKEQGHEHTQAVLTKDLAGRTSYSSQMIRDLQVWCGNITQTIDACFAGVDRKLRDQYRQTFAHLSQAGDRRAAETFEEELFAYRALLINVLTEPHIDHKDWTGGWAWLTPFGSFQGGLICIPLLRRKLQFQPGSVFGIKGDRVEHYTTKWRGSNRYSWVFTFHENVRRNGC